MTAVRVFDPCETAMKITAIQITVNNIRDIILPESETGCVLLVSNLLQFFEMGLKAFVVAAGAWDTRMIDIKGRDVGYWLSHGNENQAARMFTSVGHP